MAACRCGLWLAWHHVPQSSRALTPARSLRVQVANAITREKKEAIVEQLKGKLDDSVVVFGFRFKSLDVSGWTGRMTVGGLSQ